MANPALAEVVGPWADQKVKDSIIALMKEGFRIVHMGHEKRRVDYVDPNDADYTRKMHMTNAADEMTITYLAREK